jgi:ABC-2 type transport system permease protein
VTAISAYIYIAKIKILASLVYRFEVYSTLITNFIMVFAVSFFWKVAYRGIGAVDGVDEKQMITYSIISTLLSAAFVFNVEDTVNSRIREGDIALDFIKPLNVFGIYLAQDIGSIASSLMLKVIPLFIVSSVFISVPLPASLRSLILFLFSCILSYMILWLLSAIVGLTSFWIVELGPLGHIKNALVGTISGSFIPVWFFPDVIRNILEFMPFIYIYQLPLGIYIGKTDFIDSIKGMTIQFVWVCIMLLIFYVMQRKARNRVFIQGG